MISVLPLVILPDLTLCFVSWVISCTATLYYNLNLRFKSQRLGILQEIAEYTSKLIYLHSLHSRYSSKLLFYTAFDKYWRKNGRTLLPN
jgi:hypothetical protein